MKKSFTLGGDMLCEDLADAKPAETEAEARRLYAKQVLFYLGTLKGWQAHRQAAKDLREQGLVPADCCPEWQEYGSLAEKTVQPRSESPTRKVIGDWVRCHYFDDDAGYPLISPSDVVLDDLEFRLSLLGQPAHEIDRLARERWLTVPWTKGKERRLRRR